MRGYSQREPCLLQRRPQGIWHSSRRQKVVSFSLEIETGKLNDIKGLDSSLRPQAELHPAIRFALAPDGKSFAYSVVKSESSVWMLQGFANK